MIEKLLLCATFPQLSLVEEEDLVADTLRFREVVSHDNNAVSVFQFL